MTTKLSALSADELIGKGVAPVRREFWKPVAPRQEVAVVSSSQSSAPAERRSKKKAKQVRGGSGDFLGTCTSVALISAALSGERRSARVKLTYATAFWPAAASLTATAASVMMLKPFWLKSPRNCRADALFLLLPNAPSVCQHQTPLTAARNSFRVTGPRAVCHHLACSVCICKPAC